MNETIRNLRILLAFCTLCIFGLLALIHHQHREVRILRMNLKRAEDQCIWVRGRWDFPDGRMVEARKYVSLDGGKHWYEADYGEDFEVPGLHPVAKEVVEKVQAAEREKATLFDYLIRNAPVDPKNPVDRCVLDRLGVKVEASQ